MLQSVFGYVTYLLISVLISEGKFPLPRTILCVGRSGNIGNFRVAPVSNQKSSVILKIVLKG